jgi:hypothetical protein
VRRQISYDVSKVYRRSDGYVVQKNRTNETDIGNADRVPGLDLPISLVYCANPNTLFSCNEQSSHSVVEFIVHLLANVSRRLRMAGWLLD